jgi:hypothetical protein
MPRSIPLVVSGLICLVALVGCRKQPTEQPEAAKPDSAQTATPEAETPEQGCKRMLERFGADIVEVELESCVTALTEGAEIGICREAGMTDDFMSCFDSCMGSVDIDPAEYSPGDSSTSPVVNCVGGCFSTTACQ